MAWFPQVWDIGRQSTSSNAPGANSNDSRKGGLPLT
jgi:hypothetical protein